MTDLERAILHIKTRADAWAVKEIEKALSQEGGYCCRTCKHTRINKDGIWCEEPTCQWEQAVTNSEAQELCDDVVSRDMALEKMADYVASGYAVSAEDFEEYSRIICQLPPVTPQSKMGHWEWVQYDYNPKLGNWHCSECHCVVLECVDKEAEGDIPLYKYCPQCGAKM